MTATQLKAIIAHGETLQAIFPKTRQMDPVRLCKQLRRLEARAHRLTTAECNGENAPGVFTVECNDIRNKLNNLLGYVAAGVPVFINGDTRGCALKIKEEWMQAVETVRRDGEIEYIGTDAVGYMHRAHPYSLHHAKKYEGYTFAKGCRLHRDMGGYGILAPEIDRNGR